MKQNDSSNNTAVEKITNATKAVWILGGILCIFAIIFVIMASVYLFSKSNLEINPLWQLLISIPIIGIYIIVVTVIKEKK